MTNIHWYWKQKLMTILTTITDLGAVFSASGFSEFLVPHGACLFLPPEFCFFLDPVCCLLSLVVEGMFLFLGV